MADYEPNDDLARLIGLVLSQQASEQEFHRLEKQLDEDPEVREFFAAASQIDVEIRHAFRTATPGVDAAHGAEVLRRHGLDSKSPSLWPRVWLWSLAVSAVLVFAVAMTPFYSSQDSGFSSDSQPIESSRPPAPVATLASQQDAVWAGPRLAVGQALQEGEVIELESGAAQISVGSGAEITAKAPFKLTFLALDRVRLDEGKIAVNVAEWATGFTVETDVMDVVDLGTTFTVSAGIGKGAETNVLKGLVRVHPREATDTDLRGLLVSEGKSLSVDRNGANARRNRIPGELIDSVDFGRLVPYRPVQLHNTGTSLSEGDEDPNWRIVVVPAKQGGEEFTEKYVIVCEPDERYIHNDRDVSQWVSIPNWREAKADATYTFQTRFDLTGYDLSTIQFFGRFLADNGVEEVRVNGEPVQLESWMYMEAGQEFGHSEFRFVNVSSGLKPGVNIVEIDVRNGIMVLGPYGGTQAPNPMALRAEWYAFGRQAEDAY